jgi:hypothetical protein
MKRVILVLLILFSIALAAQEKYPSSMKNQSGTAAAAQAKVSTAGDEAASAQTDSSADLPSDPDPNGPQQPNAKPSQSTPARGETKRKIPGSMVGYIDNAIVGSQIRIRFDAAFHDNAPDRAEFFYAQCSCIPVGPGPNPVVADLNFQQLYMHAEYAPTQRFSFFTEVPVRWIQPNIFAAPGSPILTNEAGLSDLAAGLKLAAVASSNRYLTFQFQAYFPSGNASIGLGTDHYSVEPALLYYQRLSDRVALEAQVGDWHPVGGSTCLRPGQLPAPLTPPAGDSCNTSLQPAQPPASEEFAGDVFFYGVGPSYVLYRGENVQIAPVVELVGWRVLGGFETKNVPLANPHNDIQQAVSADGTNIVNLKVGARTAVGAHSSFYIGYGHQLAHAGWYREIVRAEYRYSF